MIELVFTLIFAKDVSIHCPSHTACAKQVENNWVVVMQERDGLDGIRQIRARLERLPSEHAEHWELVQCGRDIAEQNGLELGENDAATLCHEAQHVAGLQHTDA